MYSGQKVRRLVSNLFAFFASCWSDRSKHEDIIRLLGFYPYGMPIYELAFVSRKMEDGVANNNERLEFLGDSVLASVVANYLFMHYPYRDEHFMTEMRSKIVNRETLNRIARHLGIDTIIHRLAVQYKIVSERSEDTYGNTLEALIGAIMIHKGYQVADQWIRTRLLKPFIDFSTLEDVDINIKNKLYSWAAQYEKDLTFDIESVRIFGKKKIFKISVRVNNHIVAQAEGASKKEASYVASQLTAQKLGI